MARDKSSMTDQYIQNLFAHEDEALAKIRFELQKDGKEGVNIAAHEGRLLQLLLRLIQAENVVEVGTLYGYSTLWIARALVGQKKLISIEKSEENHKKAQELLAMAEIKNNIELLHGDADGLGYRHQAHRCRATSHQAYCRPAYQTDAPAPKKFQGSERQTHISWQGFVPKLGRGFAPSPLCLKFLHAIYVPSQPPLRDPNLMVQNDCSRPFGHDILSKG